MKFRYEGERDELEAYGFKFKKGVAVDVSDAIAYQKNKVVKGKKAVLNVSVDSKLTNHPDFVVIKERNRGNTSTGKKSGTSGA